jgi:transcriptional regulator NrdR family protein
MSDPELLPIHRPRCPNCQARMTTADLSVEPQGFERHTFECPRCQHRETRVLASDPLRSNAIGWTRGELQPPRKA